MSAYLSLSPLLHFVPKFSIQKIKGGEKTSERAVRGRGGRERGESAIMDFISNPLPISRTPKKGDTVSKKRTFLNRDRSGEGDGGRIISRIWTHTHTHGPERCTPHLLRYFCCSRTSIGDVRTTKRLVVNTRVKYCKGARTAFFFQSGAADAFVRTSRMKSGTAYRENNALHSA